MNNVVKTLSASTVALALLLQNAYAEESKSEEGFYVEPKVISILGESVSEGDVELKGDVGYGVGFDLGYAVSHYAIEVDGTYAQADVTETNALGDRKTASAEYYTYGINAVYARNVFEKLAALGKIGYGWEYEDLGELNSKGTSHGVTYALGLEYELEEAMELTFEWEGANIDGPRGKTLQLGLKYKF